MNITGLNLPTTTKNTPIKVFCDATQYEDQGLAAVGWLFTDHSERVLDTHGQELGTGYTSVQAENAAVKRVLGALNSYNQAQHVKVYTDCHPVTDQLSGVDLATGNFESVTLDWIPREDNQIADTLADNWLVRGHNEARTEAQRYKICD